MFKRLRKFIRSLVMLAILCVVSMLLIAVLISRTSEPSDNRWQPSAPITHSAAEIATPPPEPVGRPPAEAGTEEQPESLRRPLIAHQIEDEQVSDTPGVYKVNLQVTVERKPSEQELRDVLTHLFNEARRKGPGKFFSRPNAVYIFAYAKQQYHPKAGSSFIGRLMYNENSGDSQPEIDISADKLDLMFKEPEERFGLTEEKRKKVFYRLVEAEDRAMKKAGAYTDDISDFDSKKFDRLHKKYLKRVCEWAKITKEQATKISIEGATKGWPMPPPK